MTPNSDRGSADAPLAAVRPPAVTRALRFIEGPAGDRFEEVALDVFRFQLERYPAYRRFCLARGIRVEAVTSWEEIPHLPTAAFQTPELWEPSAIAPARTFLTSGTRGGAEARGRHPFPELALYAAAWVEPFRRYVMPDSSDMRIFSVVPGEATLPESSLSYMVARIVERFGAPGSRGFMSAGGLDRPSFEAALLAALRDAVPVLLIGTSLGMLALLEYLEERRPALRLPEGSRILDTGGWKERGPEISRDVMISRYESELGVPPHLVIGEYGMTEMSSQFYETSWSDHRAGGPPRSPRVLAGPPWVRTRVLDPATLHPLPPGERGLLAHLDLANAWTLAAMLTEDVGYLSDEGFVLVGRAHGAQLRGCSLATQELLGG